MKNAILTWIKRYVLSHNLVRSAYIFGSFLRPLRGFGDVDIVAVFRQSNVRRFMQRIKHCFSVTFHKRLHVQIFHMRQRFVIHKFLCNAGGYMEL
jgi:Nucleotidyltransferase domain